MTKRPTVGANSRRAPGASVLAALAALALVAAACGGGESALRAGEDDPAPATAAPQTDPPDTAAPGTDASPPATTADGSVPATTQAAPVTTLAPLAQFPDCPTDALDAADGPVDVLFWHGMTNELESELIALTDAYNAGQDSVRVELQNQTSYGSTIDKFINASQSSRPDLVQLPEYTLQQFAESGTVVPVAACVEASGHDTSQFLPRTLSAYTYEGIQWSMPFNVSDPVLYYNRKVFVAAGLDPDDPPVTLEELRAVSQQIVDSGAAAFGIVIDSGPDSGGGWFIEQWFGRAGAPYADNGNGRLGPATEVLFDSATGVELLTFVQEMIDDGLAVSVGDNPDGSQSLLKMVDPDTPGAMTIGTSAALGTVIQVLGSGTFAGLTPEDIGVGPMPGPSDVPGAQVGGASLWIVADKDAAVTAGAWDYVTHLTSAQSQSSWAAGTGYVPVRVDALDLDPIKTTYADDPRFRVPYDQLQARADDITANAPVLGPQREVRVITARAVAAIIGGADVQSTLSAAVADANAAIAAYNSLN